MRGASPTTALRRRTSFGLGPLAGAIQNVLQTFLYGFGADSYSSRRYGRYGAGVVRPVAFKSPTSAVSVNSPQLTSLPPMLDVSLHGQSVLEVWLWLDRQKIAHFYHVEPRPWRV